MRRSPLCRVGYTLEEDVSCAVVSCRILSRLHARRRCIVRRCIVSYLPSTTRYNNISRGPWYRVASYLRYTVQEDVSCAVDSCHILSPLHGTRRCLVRRCIVSYLISVTRYKKMSRTPLYRVVLYRTIMYLQHRCIVSHLPSITRYSNIYRAPLYRVASSLGDFMDIVH